MVNDALVSSELPTTWFMNGKCGLGVRYRKKEMLRHQLWARSFDLIVLEASRFSL